jgi:hypothetical protein
MKDMTLKRMDNVLIVVDDLEAVKAFFIEVRPDKAPQATWGRACFQLDLQRRRTGPRLRMGSSPITRDPG